MTLRRQAARGARLAIRAGAGLALVLSVVLASAAAFAEDVRPDAVGELAQRLAEPDTQPLFRIERSKNANIVQYDARLTASGELERREPVDVYWVKVDEGIRKELDWLQRRLAYGYSSRFDDAREVLSMDMAADIGRLIDVRTEAGRYRAEIEIAGRAARLERVYVESLETGVLPQVLFIDLHGKDLETGEPLTERLTP